ncbi:MAG: hypothetical protein HY906_24965 [Deltaproteobacteria bacterium]|nr:hypothetical protein [Deltaproteobacteria bacterium]
MRPGSVDLLLRERIAEALREHDGNVRAAAAALNVSYYSLWRKARKLGLVARRKGA